MACGDLGFAPDPRIFKACITTSSLSVGTHSIIATYAGNPNNPASTSTALSQVIER